MLFTLIHVLSPKQTSQCLTSVTPRQIPANNQYWMRSSLQCEQRRTPFGVVWHCLVATCLHPVVVHLLSVSQWIIKGNSCSEKFDARFSLPIIIVIVKFHNKTIPNIYWDIHLYLEYLKSYGLYWPVTSFSHSFSDGQYKKWTCCQTY